ncbi:hypothetical protein SAMN04489857_0702 [Parafannyhessea umbonata]|uniref:Uncharacterized protein n=1 Tax=Parafannyhessea umbonata TaxID=604330 RepID=A0A1H1L5J4_9ACTN|nr:hypothetical protein SAMN04489857_0702 [Parafannyhessea umbonata]
MVFDLEPWIAQLLVSVLTIVATITIAIRNNQRSDEGKNEQMLDKIGDLKAAVLLGNQDSAATRKEVSELKTDIKAHSIQLTQQAVRLENVEATAREALSATKELQHRLDIMQEPDERIGLND